MGDIKEAFKRVKEDIYSLNQEISSLKDEINTLHKSIKELKQTTQTSQNFSNFAPSFSNQQYKSPNDPTNNPDYGLDNGFDNSTHPSTDRQINSTDSTHPSTDRHGFKPLNGQNLRISTGNKGVSTDRQTHRQTHRQQDYANFEQPDYSKEDYGNSQQENKDFNENFYQNKPETQYFNENIIKQPYQQNQSNPEVQQSSFSLNSIPQQTQYSSNQNPPYPHNQQTKIHPETKIPSEDHPTIPPQPFQEQTQPLSKIQDTQNNISPLTPQNQEMNQEQSTMNNALEILNSLDSIKKEIRFKFKKLTDQEMSVFSTLYQLNEEGEIANYKAISRRLTLSESSIRDYIGRLMNKGIPIEKKRINNKTIHLNISDDLKKIATLPTILKLRDL
ncbi:MAG: hypothetical protein ACOC1P_02120 [Minisyncoccales bacterium]